MAVAKTIRVTISGQVQRVGFRAFVLAQAIRLDVTGWVRNRADGGVEALFTGAPAAVDALCEACRRGPPGARVDHVETAVEPPPDGMHGFTILPTG